MTLKNPELILLGVGGHALSCIDVIEQQGLFSIAGLVSSSRSGVGLTHCGYRVIACDSDLKKLSDIYRFAFIGIGQIKLPNLRVNMFERLINLGFELPYLQSPFAYVSPHSKIGPGTIIMHGAIVNAGVEIGANCIINSGALVEHDVSIGDHCHISTRAILNGSVVVGSKTFIGSGCVVREGVTIHPENFLGMGSLVRRDQ